MLSDEHYMKRALALAEQGRGRVSPNPMVGCVIVRDNEIVGEGYHARFGEAHAEVAAVHSMQADSLEGCTVYVTLEPCSHQGKTPPCAALLVQRRPQRVVVAMQDPNSLVAGKGIDQLRDAGIMVEVGLLEAQARKQNEAFLKNLDSGMPFVVAKCAMTLDGKIATRTGHSHWVTGEEARRMVHQLRNEVDAILVGSRTVMLDNPSLTTRLNQEGARDPVRVILDAGEYLDSNRRVFHVESEAPTWVACTEERDYPFADAIIPVPDGKGGVDMKALMKALYKRNIGTLLIEGGGTTHASAFEEKIVDKVWTFIAPKIVGGKDAVTPVEGEGFASMEEAIQLRDMHAQAVGCDLLVEAYVE